MTTDRVTELEARLADLEARLEKPNGDDAVSIVVFSGEWDKLFAAFTIANGALSLGKPVHMFFTFWGATALRNASGETSTVSRNRLQRLFNRLLPQSVATTPLSRMNMLGLGRFCVRKLAKSKGVDDLPQLIQEAEELGVHFHCCDTSMQLFGWDCSALRNQTNTNLCGVASFLSVAMKSKTTLFI